MSREVKVLGLVWSRMVKKGVPGNNMEVSLGGNLLRDLLDTRNGTLVNGMEQRVVSCELLPYVKKLVIDSEREYAVSRPVKKRTSYRQVYSDHFSCFLTLTDLPRAR